MLGAFFIVNSSPTEYEATALLAVNSKHFPPHTVAVVLGSHEGVYVRRSGNTLTVESIAKTPGQAESQLHEALGEASFTNLYPNYSLLEEVASAKLADIRAQMKSASVEEQKLLNIEYAVQYELLVGIQKDEEVARGSG